MTPVLIAFLLAAGGQVRIEGLSDRPPDRISIFTVRDKGISTPLIAFQEKAREEVEAHLHAQVVSMEEMFTRGDLSFQAMVDCRGDAECFARVLGTTVDAQYLLVITASMIADARLVGARLIDLSQRKVIGEALGEVPAGGEFVDAVPERIKKTVPEPWWDPFGSLAIEVSPSGAQLAVNGRIVGMSPLGSLGYLLPGRYVVRAEKAGLIASEVAVVVERGRAAKVVLTLVAEEEDAPSLWWLWTGIAVVAVAGGATAAALVLTRDDAPSSFCSAGSAEQCGAN